MVKLRCATPKRAATHQAKYLTDPDDMRIMLAGFRIARQIVATEPFRSLVTEQIRPGPDITSDEQIADYIRKFGSTVYHPCGTCRMGEDDGAVVDSQLRVHGIDGLRVVDASVMPAMPRRTFTRRRSWSRKGFDIIAKTLAS